MVDERRRAVSLAVAAVVVVIIMMLRQTDPGVERAWCCRLTCTEARYETLHGRGVVLYNSAKNISRIELYTHVRDLRMISSFFGAYMSAFLSSFFCLLFVECGCVLRR